MCAADKDIANRRLNVILVAENYYFGPGYLFHLPYSMIDSMSEKETRISSNDAF